MMTSDLQGSAGLSSAPVPPLESAVDTLRRCAQNGTVPPLERTVALLAGDFWAQPDSSRRGGHGDVRDGIRRVRDAFLDAVVVFGNHDRVGDNPSDLVAFGRERGIHLASDRLVDVHGVTIAGVDGVVGDPTRRPFRRPLAEFVAAVERAVRQRPNIVLLHQGPACGTERRPAVPEIDAACQKFLGGGMVVFGHDY